MEGAATVVTEPTAEVTEPRAGEMLYGAARDGNVTNFRNLSEKYGVRLAKAKFEQSRSLLHIATKKQQLGVVEVILEKAPQLAECSDSQQSSPLHIAAEGENVEIAKKLLSVEPKMCWWRNCQNMNPIHVAAMNGRVQILQELLQIKPLAARERAYRGKTVLHLCVEYGQLEALKVLVQKFGDLVEAKDEDGDIILHSAIRSKQLEMIQYLSRLSRSDATGSDEASLNHPREQSDATGSDEAWLNHPRVAIIITIGAMIFQATLTPPGGNWQDVSSTHRAGRAVMASTHPGLNTFFEYAISIGASSWVILVLLIILGHLTKSFIVRMIVDGLMCVVLTSIFFIFSISLQVIGPDNVGSYFILRGAGVVAIVIFFNMIVYFLRKKRNTTPARRRHVTTCKLMEMA